MTAFWLFSPDANTDSYYYDTETGFYYLQSRYYDPIVKRFLNTDSYTSTGQRFLGFNMFAYCNNNPAANSDPSGTYIGHRPIMVCDGRKKEIPPKIISMEETVRAITHKPEYSEETWNGLEKDKRWDLLEEYEREVEKAMGLDPVTIGGFCDNSGTIGYYVHSERTLYLSDVLLADRERALATVRHELRHYYQNTLCDDLPRNH